MTLNQFLQTDRETYPYVFMKNVDIPLKTSGEGVLRANVFLPKDAAIRLANLPGDRNLWSLFV